MNNQIASIAIGAFLCVLGFAFFVGIALPAFLANQRARRQLRQAMLVNPNPAPNPAKGCVSYEVWQTTKKIKY